MARELNEIDLKIIKLYKDGWTTSQIGKEVGKTKNSVCGLLSRYREWNNDVGVKKTKARKFNDDGTPFVSKRAQRGKKNTVRLTSLRFKAPIKKPEKPQQVFPKGIIFWKLKRTSCRYVLNDGHPETFKFCGEPIHNKSYCAYHASICYMPNIKPIKKIV